MKSQKAFVAVDFTNILETTKYQNANIDIILRFLYHNNTGYRYPPEKCHATLRADHL